jgi:hypothetical protein
MSDDAKQGCKGSNPPAVGGVIWFIGWLFTIGFVGLPFWRAVLGLIIWPYFLGSALK